MTELGGDPATLFEGHEDALEQLQASMIAEEAGRELRLGNFTSLPLPIVTEAVTIDSVIGLCGEASYRHGCLHTIGHSIAEVSNVLPMSCTTASMNQGCFHGFLERFFKSHGDFLGRDDVTDKDKSLRMQEVCHSLPEGTQGDCYHAAAHALYATYMSLEAITDVCRYLPKGEALVCSSGGYMWKAPFLAKFSHLMDRCGDSAFPSECMVYGFHRAHLTTSCEVAGLMLQECSSIKSRETDPAYFYSCLASFGYYAQWPHSCSNSRQLGKSAMNDLSNLLLMDRKAAAVILFAARRGSRDDLSSANVDAFCWPLRQAGLGMYEALCEELLLKPQHCLECDDLHALFVPADRARVSYDYVPKE